jgi:hypothetical protein
MLGDNAYYEGTDAQYQLAVFDMYPRMLRQSVLWSTIGNHDAYADFPNYVNLPYFHIFTLPTNGEAGGVPSGTERYYSFNYANIHFVCLDSMTVDRASTGPMAQWLQADLAANTSEWLIAFWHHPPYSKGSHDSDWELELVQMRENVLPILESHGVDLVMCGHSHSYERSFLLNGHYGSSWTLAPEMFKDMGAGRRDQSGAYHKATSGPAANEGAVYVVAGSSGWTSGGSLDHPAMFISRNEMGSLVIDVDGGTLEGKFLRETGAIDDYFTIIKDPADEALRIVRYGANGGWVTLHWNSRPGKSYVVQRATDLEARDWRDVSQTIPHNGPMATWSEVTEGNGPRAYYRIRSFDD